MNSIDQEVEDMTVALKETLSRLMGCPTLKMLRNKINQLQKRKSKSTGKLLISMLEEEQEDHRKTVRTRLEQLGAANVNRILGGLKDFECILKEKKIKNSKRAKSDLQYALWKTIETQAKGKLDPKQSGMEQTNKSGMISVRNCGRVFAALLGMYPAGDPVHEWLRDRVPKWQKLGRAIFRVGCFLKSQKKRCPTVCGKVLFELWCR